MIYTFNSLYREHLHPWSQVNFLIGGEARDELEIQVIACGYHFAWSQGLSANLGTRQSGLIIIPGTSREGSLKLEPD